MGLKNFLQQQGFIAKEEPEEEAGEVKSTTTPPPVPMAPVIFPAQEPPPLPSSGIVAAAAQQPVFIQEAAQAAPAPGPVAVDPAFIKFFEDEIIKANLPGPDYFEFRQQMATMHQKLAGKGIAPEVILQTVLASFEAQNIPTVKLAEAARTYKQLLNEKKDGFLKGAVAEKENQLQKRTGALKSHQSSLDQMQRQLADLQRQIQQVEERISKERTQMEMDKTMGKEGIEKIERAEQQINLAYVYMAQAIDKDINLLQSS